MLCQRYNTPKQLSRCGRRGDPMRGIKAWVHSIKSMVWQCWEIGYKQSSWSNICLCSQYILRILKTMGVRFLTVIQGSWRRQWHPTPVLIPGKSHGRRSLVGCSPWGREESDTTERLHFHVSLLCIGEGNGNPLQCSCLENPRDGGAWWAGVYGVAQSWTRLKWLSSSSSSSSIQGSYQHEKGKKLELTLLYETGTGGIIWTQFK